MILWKISRDTVPRATDALDLEEAHRGRLRPESRVDRESCDPIDRSPILKKAFQKVLAQSLLVTEHPPPFGEEWIDLVSRNHGRFVGGGFDEIMLDEPALLVSAAEWFCKPPRHVWDTVRKVFVDPPHNAYTVLARRPPTEPKTIAHVLAFYFTRAFDKGCALSTVFSFSSSDAIPAWANEEATLVALNADKEHTIVGYDVPPLPDRPLGVDPATLSDVSAWLEGQHCAAFCFPRTPNPDLLFTLKLASGDFVRVVLHAAVPNAAPAGDDAQKLFDGLDDEHLFQENSPDHLSVAYLVGRLSASPGVDEKMHVLRVLATFPTPADLASATPAPDGDKVLATLNAAYMQSVMEGIPASDVLARIVRSVTAGFLRNGDKEEGLVGQKRKVVPVSDDAAGKRARYDEDAEKQGNGDEENEEGSKGVPPPVSPRGGAEEVASPSSTRQSESSDLLADEAEATAEKEKA